MNISGIQRKVLLGVVLPCLALYLGLRLYAQYRHVDIYVARVAPMPQELASGLHMEEHRISPTVTIETPYERAENKLVPLDEIGRLRSQIAWSSAMPALIDSLTIQSPTSALARRTTKRVMVEYQLAKRGDRWWIQDAKRSELQPHP
jgi:hypothetical protein